MDADVDIAQPRSLVFRAYRDLLPDLAAHMPRVRSIDVLRRSVSNGRVSLCSTWHGALPVPELLSSVLPTSISWDEHSSWDEARMVSEWRIESHSFQSAFRCHGETRFTEIRPRVTRIELVGDLRIDFQDVPAAAVWKPLASGLSAFFVRQIAPNLLALGDAIGSVLDEQAEVSESGQIAL